MKWSRAFVLVALVVSFLSIQPVAAQPSGGCTGGPFAGATDLDGDGDGVNDADEVVAGTDACDPAAAPTPVCSGFVVDYDASVADTDADGVTDAAETAAGTDACDASSTPTVVCGQDVADYDASVADTDADGVTDAVEATDGTDPCDSSSVLAATIAATTTDDDDTEATDVANEIPELALTGPSNVTLGLLVALVMLVLGGASLAVGRRVEA